MEVEVEVEQRMEPYQVVLPNGMKVVVGQGFCEGSLTRLVRALASC